MAERTALVYVPAGGDAASIAAAAVECARVGAAAIRLPLQGASWSSALEGATGLVVLGVDDGPRDAVLGPDPITELHLLLGSSSPRSLAVGGAEVTALLAGLAAGTHLRAGPADTPGDGSRRHDVQLVARAAALARLAGRPPMTPDEVRATWPALR
jgi:beta-keto acid cleavage enzyme